MSPEYPNPADLRARADRLAGESQAIEDSSEYPRLAKSAVAGQVQALRDYADAIENEGTPTPRRSGETGEERRERRTSILRLRAAGLKVKASEHWRRSHDIGSRIPFGQPILVGHHSERGHRRAIARMHNADAIAYGATKYADALESRADHVERSHAIQQSDSDAVAQYEAKLAKLTAERDKMKAINSAFRRNDTEALHSLGLDDGAIQRIKDKLATAYSWEKQPFPKWQISNLGAVIRDTQKKLERARVTQFAEPVEIKNEETGVTVEDCPQDNRVRLFFPGKPSAEIRTELKRNGFRWSPSIGCWQAYRNWRAQQIAGKYAGNGKGTNE